MLKKQICFIFLVLVFAASVASIGAAEPEMHHPKG
jgi:hypothetical protein